jgi:hypothetical protein
MTGTSGHSVGPITLIHPIPPFITAGANAWVHEASQHTNTRATMRSFLTLATIGLNAGLWAQCAFTPTITPVDLILRPGESALLSTQ